MSFADMKKRSKSDLSALIKETEKISNPNSNFGDRDEGYWKPELDNTQIVEELSLPPVKIHCSVLAEDAIKAAISDYKSKNNME